MWRKKCVEQTVLPSHLKINYKTKKASHGNDSSDSKEQMRNKAI